MRFLADGPNIPDDLLLAQERGEVLFLCGAGVSMPTLPSFLRLAFNVAVERGMAPDDPMRIKLADALSGKAETPKLDDVFEQLREAYGDGPVEASVAKLLRPPKGADLSHHRTLLRLSKDARGRVRIVTTNFDPLFERARPKLKYIAAPMLPELRDDHPLESAVYLHGRLSFKPCGAGAPIVLSAADFGRAYLAEGWATRFIRDVLSRYVVVLVGYSADDPPISYLLQGLKSLHASPNRPIYAFAAGEPAIVDAHWRRRNVQAIAYAAHDDKHANLWMTLDAWADRAENPEAWRRSLLENAQRGPRALAAHERGQIVSMVKTVEGARAFAHADPPPPAEWLCAFDAGVRYEAPAALDYGQGEKFDPLAAYGLDDDPPRNNDKKTKDVAPIGVDVLAPLPLDGVAAPRARIAGGWGPGYEPLCQRLDLLAIWIARNWSSPVALWWVGVKGSVNSALLQTVKHVARTDKAEAPEARKAWALIAEVEPASPLPSRWYALEARLKAEGWTNSTLRAFAEAIRPRLLLQRPIVRSFGAVISGKPLERYRDWVSISIDWFKRDGKKIPSSTSAELVAIVREVREALRVGASLTADVADISHRTPSIEPESGPGSPVVGDDGVFFLWFVALFTRLIREDADGARREMAAWPTDEPFFFDKLRLWAWMHPALASGEGVSEGLAQMPDRSFWQVYARRELLRMLRARWADFSPDQRLALERRLRAGQPKRRYESDEEFAERVAAAAASCFGWLKLSGCVLSDESEAALPEIQAAAGKDWNENWAASADHSYDGRSGGVRTNTDCAAIADLPFGDIVPASIKIASAYTMGFVRQDPFLGLIKTTPLRAFWVLSFEARRKNYPVSFWNSLLQNWPKESRPRATWLLAAHLKKLPAAARADLRFSIVSWLEENWEALEAYRRGTALALWDALFDALGDGGEKVESNVLSGPEGTLDKAFNAPIGRSVRLLLKALSERKLKAGSTMPAEFGDRLEGCLAVPGAGGAHAAAILGQDFHWLCAITPDWAAANILPRFDLEHPHAFAAWDGLLWDSNLPRPDWFAKLKPAFLAALAHAERWRDREGARRLGQLLCAARCYSTPANILIDPDEARSALRATTDEVRVAALHQLESMVGQKSGWRKYGAPFLASTWPLELIYQTPETTQVWLRISTESGKYFPVIARALTASPVLTPVDQLDLFMWTMRGEEKEEGPIAKAYPREALALLNAVISETRQQPPYDMGAVLDMLAEAEPSLRQDSRWLRLRDIGRRDRAA